MKTVTPLDDLQNSAARLLKAAVLPVSENESWRKVPLRGFQPEKYTASDAESAVRVVGGKMSELSSWKESAVFLNRIPKDLFTLHNLAAAQNAYKLDPESDTVSIRHELLKGRFLNNVVLIHVPAGGSLKVMEEFPAAGDALYIPLTIAVLEENSSLEYVSYRNFGEKEIYFPRFEAFQGSDSRLNYGVLQIGGKTGKCFVSSVITGQGARFRGTGLSTLGGREFCDQEMLVRHQASHSVSSLLYKTILKDRAFGIFNGKLEIEENVVQVNSNQLNNNILLGEEARAESVPGLVIRSDDVECRHGATVGKLDEDSLFFLLARGIPKDQARRLLLEGYMNDVLNDMQLGDRHTEIVDAMINKIWAGE